MANLQVTVSEVLEAVTTALIEIGITDRQWVSGFTTAIAIHLNEQNNNSDECKDWMNEIDNGGIDAIAAFYEGYGFLPYNVSSMEEHFYSVCATAEQFVKELFDSFPASTFGESYAGFCWELNEFTDEQWDALDWKDAASCLDSDNLYHFVEFNGSVYVFQVQQ